MTLRFSVLKWLEAIRNIYTTFCQQQRKEGVSPYKFQRKTERALDTLNNDGLGAPVRPVGLIVSCFRPSDDATTLQFLVPSNFFAVTSLRKAAEILETVNRETALAADCRALADEVEMALKRYAPTTILNSVPSMLSRLMVSAIIC